MQNFRISAILDNMLPLLPRFTLGFTCSSASAIIALLIDSGVTSLPVMHSRSSVVRATGATSHRAIYMIIGMVKSRPNKGRRKK